MIRPLRDHVLIKRGEKETMFNATIHIPGECQKKVWRGKVVAVGNLVSDCKVGDVVLTANYVGIQVPFGDTEHIMLRESEIEGVLNG